MKKKFRTVAHSLQHFLKNRSRQDEAVMAANNNYVKRFYNLDHNAYLHGALDASAKELMGLCGSMVLRCDDCIFYHLIQSFRLGTDRAKIEETINIALVIGGSIVVPHMRRAYELLDELFGEKNE